MSCSTQASQASRIPRENDLLIPTSPTTAEWCTFVNLTSYDVVVLADGSPPYGVKRAPYNAKVSMVGGKYGNLGGIPLKTPGYGEVKLVGKVPDVVEGDVFIVDDEVGDALRREVEHLYAAEFREKYPWCVGKLVVTPDLHRIYTCGDVREFYTKAFLVYYDGRPYRYHARNE
jgi:hypothetical protein